MKNNERPAERRRTRVIGLGLVIPLLVTACGVTGAPSTPATPAGTAVPTPVAEWATFESDRYGYAIDHPADWEPKEKVGDVAFAILRPYNPGSDFITSAEHHQVLTRHGVQVAVDDVEPGTDLVEMTNDVHMPCGGPYGEKDITLGGEPAISRTFSCDGNHPVYIQVTAIHAERGYVLWLMTTERPHADDRPEYEAMIESFDFTDVTAGGGG